MLHIIIPDTIRVYYTIIRPVLLYGDNTWVMNNKEERELIVLKKVAYTSKTL